ncbi:MAG: CCA tRNA nucleotidyltransferase [Planctomycetes bacterium]|nr:CCA tRNA nucleotidyltransferase [Planctomycetota bacterium]
MAVARIDGALPPLPAAVEHVLRQLRREGHAWLVGGTVRDLLLGAPPRDFDLATDLTPAAVRRLLPGADARDAAFGVVVVPDADRPTTVTTLRREADYADGRRPRTVEFVRSVPVDAQRRDFTVNALYLDPATREVLDPCGGLADLAARTLRTVGPAPVRFAEDSLRLLRAVRFAARCGFTLEPTTAAAIPATAAGLRHLAAERVFAELSAAFTGPGRGRALRLLVELGLAAVVLPEAAATAGVTQPKEFHPEGDVLTHVALVLDHVPAGDLALAWSAVLHDVGKPPTWRLAEDRIRFDGHDQVSATMADAVLRRLHAPNDLRALVVDVCRQHIRFASLPQMRPRRREAWLRSPHFAVHLAFHRADCLGSHGKLDVHEFARAALLALPPAPAPLLSGADVLALGVPSGPVVGELLRAVHAAADEAPTPWTRADALARLGEMVERWRQGAAPRAR